MDERASETGAKIKKLNRLKLKGYHNTLSSSIALDRCSTLTSKHLSKKSWKTELNLSLSGISGLPCVAILSVENRVRKREVSLIS